MAHDDCQLGAVVTTMDGGFQAQLLEVDIAARGDTVDDLLREIEHALVVTYEIARDQGEIPFISVLSPHPEICGIESGATPLGFIELPKDVGEALAAVLHFLRPIRKISVLKKAA